MGHPAVCLNSPAFQEYALGLYSDLAANYDLDYIQTCLIPYVLRTKYLTQNLPRTPLIGLWSRRKKADAFAGIAWPRAKKVRL